MDKYFFDILAKADDGTKLIEFMERERRDCKLDHGNRTNNKLKDQPFHHRTKTGKMKKW